MVRHIALIIMMFFAAGCAAPADMNSMVVSKTPAERMALPNSAKGVFSVTRVNGGEETSPLWTSEVDAVNFRGALERSLEASGLAGMGTPARHGIDATLKKLDQPMIGFDMTVTSTVNYTVRDLDTKDVWFDENITAPYTATVGDAFSGVTRLKLANEGSIRENITIFIDEMIRRLSEQ